MKTRYIVIALSVLAAAYSCSKTEQLPAPQKDLVTITAVLPDDEAVKGGDIKSILSWTWNDGDKLTVIGETTEEFTIQPGFTPKKAEFTGAAVKGTKFTILYPGDKARETDWNKQVQRGNNNTGHLVYQASLNDVDTYTTFCFNDEWAGEHGGTLKQTGVLKLTLNVPAGITTPSLVTLSADEAIFYSGNSAESASNSIALKIQDYTVTDGEPMVAWFTTSWNEAVVPAETTLYVTVSGNEKSLYRDVFMASEKAMKTGFVNLFTLSGTDGWADDAVNAHYAGGKGTKAAPWIIMNAEQMACMYGDMAAGSTRYFKLGADIDMKDITDWTPLNAEGSFEKRIDFDGAGHTISNFSCSNAASYTSFFGVLYGKCYNVKFVNAKIVTDKNGAGILGGYLGTAGKPGEVSHVSVQGTLSGAGTLGGLFGNVREATITACSADVEITATGQNVGGIFGLDAGIVTVTDCWSAGSVVSSASIVGGICGDLKTAESALYNCYSTAVVKSQYFIGGIAGRANQADKKNQATKTPNNHIENCIAWNTEITSNCADASEHYSSGVIVGSTAQKNYLKNGWRKADITFNDCPGNAAKGTDYAPFDQEDSDPDHPMAKSAGTYAFAYHGKAAGAAETLSQVAQRIGWSADVWDFSGDTPKLK